ncbi:DNA mismatch repair protein MutT [Rhizobium sullae]|uniref:DNA mismatch repair protein MutT n=1 Tax=Rhizobium sullae TaxID=50338 RepID=A0A2N0D9Z4_RHISU|nr:DNA mismatch repair protein MutT [Rhizobium sullae]PKA42906.1 DNA mismatch repair protein MutT [Rhizobium sullae]
MSLEFSDDFAGWPPERTVFPVASIDLRVLPGEHPFHLQNAALAGENWKREISDKPELFDGRMVFQHELALNDGGIAGAGHIIPFSTFMWWRKQAERRGGIHLFAFGIMVSSDGAIIAVRMGAHTANAGQVYCAAGSLDLDDIAGGCCDVEGNMRREVIEETGLDLRDATPDATYYASHFRRTVTVFRLFRFDLTADEMIERIAAHMLVAEDKEIAGAVAIRSADHSAYPYNVAMLPIIDWYFANINDG